MSEDRLAVEIREAFDEGYEPDHGLEERVVASIPWTAPQPRRFSAPRLAGAFAGVLAVVLIGVLIAPSMLNRLGIVFPGSGGVDNSPAYSLAAVSGDSLWLVQRGLAKPGNVLLQSRDGGRSWIARLQFKTEFEGMQMFGQHGYLASFDVGTSNCGAYDQTCRPQQPTFALSLYRTADGGVTWTTVTSPVSPAQDVYFMDGLHGWVSSGMPAVPPGAATHDFLYATADGGQSWTLAGQLPDSALTGWIWGVGQYHVTFRDELHGWYLGNQKLFSTDDGGRSWQTVVVDPPAGRSTWTVTPSQPAFKGQDGVLAMAYRDPNGGDNITANLIYFYVSHDGGATWADPRSAPAGFAPVGDDLAITILDLQHFWLTSQSLSGGDNVQASPAVARTADGGLSWKVTQHTPRILQMTFRDANHGYALDVTGMYNVNGILSTSDGGATWQRVLVPVFT